MPPSLKKCSNCDKFGHTRRECHKLADRRLQELERRAEVELAEQMAEDEHDQRDAQFEEFINPPANLTHSSPTPTPQTHPTQSSPDTSSLQTPCPTPSNRDTSENGQHTTIINKNHAINQLFAKFSQGSPNNAQMELDVDQTISDELYQQYVDKRKQIVVQARREVVTEHYPARDQKSLTRNEWDAITDFINGRFRELLIAEFPANHFELNSLYLSKKQDGKPP